MKSIRPSRQRGFTLIETVIAIGVLAVLLTGFIVVFTPAAEGIRKSLNVQQADRLASALEQELVTLRKGQESATIKTGFDKSFDWIKSSNTATNALFVYQYRGGILKKDNKTLIPLRDDGTLKPSGFRDDGTLDPSEALKELQPGKHYVVVPMMRRKSDPLFEKDLAAVEGAVYLVKPTQLVFSKSQLVLGTAGSIKNPKPNPTPPDPNYKPGPFDKASDYPEAVIAFSAEFFMLPANTASYFGGSAFATKFSSAKNPFFTRNLAVLR
jgi:prepilin-type N-terminal cleavage/methylation domain-containing protein